VDYRKKEDLAWLLLNGNSTNKFPEYSSPRCSPPLPLAPLRAAPRDREPAALPEHGEPVVPLLGSSAQGRCRRGTDMKGDFPSTHTGCRRRSQPGTALPGQRRADVGSCSPATAKLMESILVLSIRSNHPVLPTAACTNISIYYRDKYLQRSSPSWHSAKGHT